MTTSILLAPNIAAVLNTTQTLVVKCDKTHRQTSLRYMRRIDPTDGTIYCPYLRGKTQVFKAVNMSGVLTSAVS